MVCLACVCVEKLLFFYVCFCGVLCLRVRVFCLNVFVRFRCDLRCDAARFEFVCVCCLCVCVPLALFCLCVRWL